MKRITSLPTALLALLYLSCSTTSLAQFVTSATSGSKSSSTSSSSSAAATFTVRVGDGSNSFTPDVVQANPGDVIEFDFYPQNHSVVRAEYLKPCIPYEDTGVGKIGFFSGFHPVDAILNSPPKWTLKINDSDPVFYYCSAPGSCIDYQMVGVINPNASVSLAAQKQAAAKSSYMLQPGEPFPAEGSSSSTSSAAPSTTTSHSSTSPATVTAAPSATAAASSSGLGGGAIAGIAIGSAAIALLIAGLLFFMGRTRRLKKEVEARQSMAVAIPPGGPSSGPGGTMSPTAPMSPRGDMVPGVPPAGAMFQSGGTVYVPIKTADLQRNSGIGFAPVPPYESHPSNNNEHGLSLRAASPHSEAGSMSQYSATGPAPVHPALRPGAGGEQMRYA